MGVNICRWDKAGGRRQKAGGKRVLASFIFVNIVRFYSAYLLISERGDEVFTSADSIARVSDYDLERVRL